MIWQCWLTRAFSSAKAQSLNPDVTASQPEWCPVCHHQNLNCGVCKSQAQHKIQKKRRKSSAPECLGRPRRASHSRHSTFDPQVSLSNGPLSLHLQEQSGRIDEFDEGCGVQDSKVLSQTTADPNIPFHGPLLTNQDQDSLDTEQISDTKILVTIKQAVKKNED